MNLFEKLNRLDDSLVESKRVVKKKKLTEGIWAYQTYIEKQPSEKQPSKSLTYGNHFIMSRSPYRKERFGADWKRHINKIIEWCQENNPGLIRVTHDFRLDNFGKNLNTPEAFIAAIEHGIETGEYELVLTESVEDADRRKEFLKRCFTKWEILDLAEAHDDFTGRTYEEAFDYVLNNWDNFYLEDEYEAFCEDELDDNIDEMLTESTEQYELSTLVKDSINHLVNDLGKDPMADDFGDDVCADLEDNYDVYVPQDPVKYGDWCSAVMSEVSRQLNNKDELTESKDTDYVIMFTNNDKHLFFIDPDKFTSDLMKATIYPGKFSAEDDIKYAIDAAQDNLTGVDDYVDDMFSAISVKEAKSISVNNDTELSVDITAKPGREYIIVLEGGGYNHEFWNNQKQKWTNNLSKATRFMTLTAAKDAVGVCWHKIRTGSDEHLINYAKIRIVPAPQEETGSRWDYIEVAEKYGFRGTEFYKSGPRIPTVMSLTIGNSKYDIIFNGQTVNASARIVGKDIDTTVFTVEDLENILSTRFSKVTKVNASDTQLNAIKQTIQSYAGKNNVSQSELKNILKKVLTELE